jgi:hypothetical protein
MMEMYLLENKKRMNNEKKSERLTGGIKHWRLSGYSSVLPRINFGLGGQESSPQSLTAYSLNRYRQA